MKKQELIARVSEKTGLSRARAAVAVESMIDGITRSLRKGEPGTVVGFGTFKTRARSPRTANRRPATPLLY
jgi:DNA-binding protein HU-beta